MTREDIILACTCEIAGLVRGKGFPVSDLASRLVSGVGWIPTNTMMSPQGPIVSSPFGARDDLILVPDPKAEVHVRFEDGGADEWFYLSDLRHLDGTPWMGCPRQALRRALAALHDDAGVTLLSAFEHEFTYDGVAEKPLAPYSLDAYRRQGVFGSTLLAAMRAAGTRPDSFLSEYAPRQFEVTCKPAAGIRAADDAVIVREMARAVASRLGHRASFTPITDVNGVGNGVHIHFSLVGGDGGPAMYDAADPLLLSAVGRRFVAGVLHHMPALCALTAPCPVSYVRLRPNRWAPVTASLGAQDREAALRICPVLRVERAGEPGRQFNVEYRPADASASPYLALAALVFAGADGIARGLEIPEPRALPATLAEALNLLEATPQAADWFPGGYLDLYLRFKRDEIGLTRDLDDAARCAVYADIY